MKITDLLKKDGVALNQKVADQNAAIDVMVELHDKVGNLKDKEAYKKDIEAREAKGSTAVGMGIAVPHAKSAAVKQAGLVAMTVPEGVDYKSADGQPSNLLFMIAAPDGEADHGSEGYGRMAARGFRDSFPSQERPVGRPYCRDFRPAGG